MEETTPWYSLYSVLVGYAFVFCEFKHHLKHCCVNVLKETKSTVVDTLSTNVKDFRKFLSCS